MQKNAAKLLSITHNKKRTTAFKYDRVTAPIGPVSRA